MSNATILIVARNAASTIERAVRSAVEQAGASILLVDDDSEDQTVPRAQAIGGERLRIVRVEEHATLGAARQLGLESIDTEFCVLLDADDELLPGRVGRLIETMEQEETDAVFDEIELWDEKRNEFLKHLSIPTFLENGSSLCRLFERNYLPGIGQMGFRAAFFKQIGYDKSVHGPEDTDIVLRALVAGARFSLIRKIGYRMYHNAVSVSRNLSRQNEELKSVLEKHSYERVEALYRDAGYSRRIALWATHALAIFRHDNKQADHCLNALEGFILDPGEVLELTGPLSMGEGARLEFARGVQALIGGSGGDAQERFERVMKWEENPEVLNNLGVAEAMLGNRDRAEAFFRRALEAFPAFVDARKNLSDSGSRAFTRLPLRRQASRDLY